MNPKIAIAVANNKATATLTGMVTVGAKVDVEVTGLSHSDIPQYGSSDVFTGYSLRFRIVDVDGKDLVRFPLVEKDTTTTPTTDGDKWTLVTDATTSADTFKTQSGESDSPYVEFNTDALVKAFAGVPYNDKLEFGIVLDSLLDSAQYAVGKMKVSQWATEAGDTPVEFETLADEVEEIRADLATHEESGEHLPSGGTAGQVLTKKSATDYDAEWQNAAATSVAWTEITGKPDTFTPATHASTHATGGADALTPASIGALTADTTVTTAWDTTPTANSTKAVTSGGVKSAIDAAPRASLMPLGDGVWQMVDTGAGWVVEGGVVSWLAAGKTAFTASEYYGHTTLTQVVAPNVTSVGDYAFNACAALTSLSLPAATSIGVSAFNGCAALTSLSLPAATSVGDSALESCTALTSLSLPAATSIGVSAFYGCAALTSLSLPAATSVGDYALESCDALTSLSLPLATTIGNRAFSSTELTSLNLSSLTVATVTANAHNWAIPSGCVVTCSDGTYTVPSAS